jgi:hypothetical protein
VINDDDFFSIVKRDAGYYIIDFENVEENLETSAKIFGPFRTEDGAEEFIDKFLSAGFTSDGILFLEDQ